MLANKINYTAIKFIIVGLFVLTLTRVFIIYSFGSGFDTTELINAFWLGFRFDLKLLATILAIVYLINLLSLNKISYKVFNAILVLFLSIIIFLSFVNFGYYKFFGNEFNSLFFGIKYDGTSEVIASIVSDKLLIMLSVISVVTVAIFVYIWQKFQPKNLKDNYATHIVILVIMVVLARGSLGTFPLNKKTINSVDNTFLSNVLLNPSWQLYYAYKDLKLNHLTSCKKVLHKNRLKSYEELLAKAGFSKQNPLILTTPKNEFLEQNKPNVIFVLMESWSSYIALFDSKDNDVLGSFKKHSKEDYFFIKFLSNAYGTNPTIEELLLNSPIKDLSQSQAKDIPFSLFTLNPYIKNGYSSVFLSGGSSSWRNHNRFWKTQGFDSYIGRASIEKYYQTKCDNTWGVYDGLLFKYLEDNVFKANKKPFFAFVLTTNNHPPVELPKDFKMPQINLEYYGLSNKNQDKKTRLGAYKYQTNALGDFITWLKHSQYKDNTIVVATGDHIIKGFKDYKTPDELFYKYGVPLYLYVPDRYDKLKSIDKNIVGSHNDIFPTLYNLTLSDSKYYNFGTSLMDKKEKSFGWNEQNKYIFDNGVSNKQNLYDWDNNLTVANKPTTLSEWQFEQISTQKYKNILIEYLLNKEFKNYHQ
jgi:phosphoglycerol transferase MdoB-like AlkP superfamily enzyme